MLGASCAEKGLARRSTRIATSRSGVPSRDPRRRVASAELHTAGKCAAAKLDDLNLDSCYNRVTYEGCRPLSKSQDALQRLEATGPER